MNLTALNKGQGDYTDLGFNKLSASNPSVIAFLNTKDPDCALSQTVPPANPTATAKPRQQRRTRVGPGSVHSATAATMRLSYSTTPGGPYSVHGTDR